MNMIEMPTAHGGGIMAKTEYHKLYNALPNLESDADESKGFQLFRELKPQRKIAEFTLYYRTKGGVNGSEKKRVDFDISTEDLDEHAYIMPDEVTITYWGSASVAIQ